MEHKLIPITKELFKQHLAGFERHVFIAEKDIPKKFKRVVERVAREYGELFLSEACVVTERLSPLAEAEVVRVAKRNGYHAVCTKRNHRLRYLGSDFGGHYSTDFYELLEYTEIHVSPLTRKRRTS